MSKRLPRLSACLLAAAVLATGIAGLDSAVARAQDNGATLEEIAVRDELIAAQESLLNAYRCRFNTDIQLVPGGCTDGHPSQGPTEPGSFAGTPTHNEAAVRDELIAAQESLLNAYRCRFNTDIRLVPGGCVQQPAPTLLDVHLFYCVPESAGYTESDLQDEANRLNAEVGEFYLRESSNSVGLNFVPGGIVSPDVAWHDVMIGDWSKAHGLNPCESQIYTQGSYPYILILAGISSGNGAAGYASFEQESTTVPTLEKYLNDNQSHSILVGHEIGHSVFKLGHDSEFLSIMITPSARRTLNANRIGCDDLYKLGWPQHNRCDLNKLNIPDDKFTAITAAQYHSCGLREDGTAECWGKNYLEPIDTPSGSFTAITAGNWHSCGLRSDGDIECWGFNDDERGNMVGLASPPQGRFTAITAGYIHTCGLRENRTVKCWGSNSDIWLNRNVGQSNAPGGTFTAIAAGTWHTCGLRQFGTVRCWGSNQDGHGNFVGQSNAPSDLFAAVAAGSNHTCGLRKDGTVQCWGANDFGASEAPSGRFTAIAAAPWHTCGLREDATIHCWGG